jgi:hypothetical protein
MLFDCTLLLKTAWWVVLITSRCIKDAIFNCRKNRFPWCYMHPSRALIYIYEECRTPTATKGHSHNFGSFAWPQCINSGIAYNSLRGSQNSCDLPVSHQPKIGCTLFRKLQKYNWS